MNVDGYHYIFFSCPKQDFWRMKTAHGQDSDDHGKTGCEKHQKDMKMSSIQSTNVSSSVHIRSV